MNIKSQYRPVLLAAILFVIAFDATSLWQRLGGAYSSEFGGHPDEAAHFVMGLMMRDYVSAGFPGSPIKYAENYYSHYPTNELGTWPPIFYVVQTMWTLPFGESRVSVIFLIGVLASSTALLIFLALRSEMGGWYAGLGALLWISLPLVREYYGMVMAEMLSTLLMFGSTLMFGRFLDREQTADAIVFGVLAGLAIMTKGTGLALAPMVAFAFLFSRKWYLLTRPALWSSGSITVLVAGPWTWKFLDFGKGGWVQPRPSFNFTAEALLYYTGKFGAVLGPLLLAFFILGVFYLVLWRQDRENSGCWIAAGSLILGVFLFQSVTPIQLEARHLISALPSALLFVVAGFKVAVEWLPQRSKCEEVRIPTRAKLASGVVVILLFASLLPVQTKGFSGYARVAEEIVKNSNAKEPVLVSSDARGEGMFIAEMALRDPMRPSFTVQRVSKTFANGESSGRGYQTEHRSYQDVYESLQGKATFVVLDDSVPIENLREHHYTLKRTVDLYSSTFWLVSESKVLRGGKSQKMPLRLFRFDRRRGN